MELILVILFLALLILLGSQLFIIIGGLSLLLFHLYTDVPLFATVKSMFDSVNKSVFLSIPLYVFAGAIMSKGEIAKRLINLSLDTFGWLKGGLAVACVVACIFFAAISGSSPVTLIAIGSIMYPALIQNGYPDKIALGVLTVAGSLGILIPPSIPMIIFSIVTGTDVNELFMAGVVPGIMCGIFLILLSIYYGYKYKLATKPFSGKNLLSSLKKGLPALFMPVLVLGGIYTGLYTVTEAAAVAAVYAIVIEMFVYRDIKITDLIDTLYDSVIVLGIIFIIISMATVFNYFLTLQEAPVMLLDWMSASVTTQSMFLVCTIILLLIVGLFMDIISAILILAPLLVPAAMNYEVNLVHLGIIFVLGMEIGYMTPPVGINLFVASSVFDKPFGKVVVAAIPYTLCLLVALILVTFIPDIALFLNDMVKGSEPIID